MPRVPITVLALAAALLAVTAVADDPYTTVAARQPDQDVCAGLRDDRASTYLAPGAALHPVDDWSPRFRLVAVEPSGRLVLYQAMGSTTARLAGDELDLRGRADALIESILVSRIDPTGAREPVRGSPSTTDGHIHRVGHRTRAAASRRYGTFVSARL